MTAATARQHDATDHYQPTIDRVWLTSRAITGSIFIAGALRGMSNRGMQTNNRVNPMR